ncbi:MAG: hypothetical protein IH955_09550, partial [Chloroflexi bacterium]|nr:hypothetical protein [Chloroflexota bacterium]
MTVESTPATERWSLQQQCDFISKVYGLWGGGMTVVTYAQQGEDTVVQWRYAILHNHQKGYFLEGLKKLGIDPEREPPAVVAAKYHFFSNALGGLDMEMVEESPNKAWIRYNAPFGPAGTGWLAIPPRMGRAIFAGWHPYNALRLNRPRLGFVLCKGFTDGEPYAEGYFMEYDHDLTEEERFRFDPAATMPEFDPETAPKLDAELWPPDRRAKAKRNFGRGYVEESVLALLQLLGTPVTAQIVRRAYQGIAIQYGKELLDELGIEDTNARGLATFMKYLGDMAGDTTELTSPSPDRHLLRTTHRRLFLDDP